MLRVEHLFISPGHNFFGHHEQPAGEHPIVAVEQIECVAGRGIRGDRFFARVRSSLRDEVKNSQASNLFHEVPGLLHAPPPGFALVDSFKTFDPFGNLQLTFFNKPGTLEFIVDADIDDAQGLEHITQIVDHTLVGTDTNPFDIHEILLATQHLNPGYDLVV